MMVTMSLFTISMLAILAILSSSIGLIQKFYRDDSSRLQSDVFLTRLDQMSREAIRVNSFSSRNLSFYYRDGKRDDLEISQNEIQIISYGKEKKQIRSRKYIFNDAKEIRVELTHFSPPQVLHALLVFGRGRIERTLMLGYQKPKEVR